MYEKMELNEHLKLAAIFGRQSGLNIFEQSTTCQYNYMYNIVQNGDFVISSISGLPAIYKARWNFITLILSLKTSFIYIFQYSV